MDNSFMEAFNDYLSKIENLAHCQKPKEVLDWIHDSYPRFEHRIAWKQPIFTDHGTYIIGFSVAKGHLFVAPEKVVLDKFRNKVHASGYLSSKNAIKDSLEPAGGL